MLSRAQICPLFKLPRSQSAFIRVEIFQHSLRNFCQSSSGTFGTAKPMYVGHSKSNEIRYKKILYFRQSVLHKILAPDVFDYGDSKSESWHRAKKMREVFMVSKSSRALFAVMENRVCLAAALKQL